MIYWYDKDIGSSETNAIDVILSKYFDLKKSKYNMNQQQRFCSINNSIDVKFTIYMKWIDWSIYQANENSRKYIFIITCNQLMWSRKMNK